MFAVIGAVFFIVAGFLAYRYFQLKKRVEQISGVETSTVKALQEICEGVATEIGKGSFEQIAEIKGVIECDNPIESEIAKQPCVYYSMAITRKWEEDYHERNQQTGRDEKKTRQGSETVASNTRSVPFMVRDDTGAILVNPNSADIEGEKAIDRFEAHTGRSGGTISFGGFSFSLGGLSSGGNRRTLGYNFTETILPLKRKVFVLGAASDMAGELTLQKPREKDKDFLISLKSEEEILTSSKSGMTWSLVGAIACALIGLVLIVLQLTGKLQ